VQYEQSLQKFIIRRAKRIAAVYSNSRANEEDYIQAGLLKLVEITKNKLQIRNFRTYAIVAIGRAMRNVAIDASFSLSAPIKVKLLAIEAGRKLKAGQSKIEICKQLNITPKMWQKICQLMKPEISLSTFNNPLWISAEDFTMLNEILGLSGLTIEDQKIILARYDRDIGELNFTRKRLSTKIHQIRKKLNRRGYGNNT